MQCYDVDFYSKLQYLIGLQQVWQNYYHFNPFQGVKHTSLKIIIKMAVLSQVQWDQRSDLVAQCEHNPLLACKYNASQASRFWHPGE